MSQLFKFPSLNFYFLTSLNNYFRNGKNEESVYYCCCFNNLLFSVSTESASLHAKENKKTQNVLGRAVGVTWSNTRAGPHPTPSGINLPVVRPGPLARAQIQASGEQTGPSGRRSHLAKAEACTRRHQEGGSSCLWSAPPAR